MAYFVYIYVYWIILVALLSVVFLPLTFLHWPDHGIFVTIRWLVAILFILSYFLVAPWIARSAAKRKVEFGQGFFLALSGALENFV